MVLALAFDFTNGFHDAANAIATAVSTRALTPRLALSMAALMNLVGALLGTGVAKTIADTVDLEGIRESNLVEALLIVLAGLVGAIAWNLITWWRGLPSSSSHALIGGLTGAGLAAMVFFNANHTPGQEVGVHWSKITEKVFIPMVVSPVVGFSLAFGLMLGLLWLFRRANPHKVTRNFRHLQIVSAALMALGHGLQDAQKTMGVMFMAAVAIRWQKPDSDIPLWIMLLAAGAISLGTYSGGWRIMRTLGRKIIELDPVRGFAAETVAASVLYTTAFVFHAPISTTHTITSAIMGVGATKRLSAVRWGVAKNIVGAWLLTIPAAAGSGALVFFAVHGIQLLVG
ncbi:MAG: inorganic phosphate transporter [Micrococcales bacterium]|nr:inorganic phosphate transporter [Micrococcales bacterium]